MSDISIVRNLIPDRYEFDQATITPSGTDTLFNLPNYPVLDGSQSIFVGTVLQSEGGGAYTIDNDTGVIVFSDPPADPITVTYKYSILSDDAIQDYLDLEGGDHKLAAADALEAVAVNEALVLKIVKLLDLQVDGTALAKTLLGRAKTLREQVAADDEGFTIVEFSDMTAAQRRELIWKDLIKNSV